MTARLGMALLLLAVGCAHTPYIWVDDLSEEAFAPQPYRLAPGDKIDIKVWNQPKLSTTAQILPDGKITIALIGDVGAAGLTPSGLGEQIGRLLTDVVVDPKVTIAVTEPKRPMVTVMGEVRRVGKYPLEPNATVLEFVAHAGGITEFANPNHIYVLRRHPKVVRVRFSLEQLSSGVGRALAFRLRAGDIVVVE